MRRQPGAAHRAAGVVTSAAMVLVAVTMTARRENPSDSTTPTDAAPLGLSEPEAGLPENIDWLCGLSVG